mgnify:CR=1 FL=1
MSSYSEHRAAVEHTAVINALQNILATKDGKVFAKYIMKVFDINEPPAIGMAGEMLQNHLGFLRAGNSVYKLFCQANIAIAGEIIAQIEKEKYEEAIFEARTE